MRVGILTGGGDCPGLNAVIRAVTRRAIMAHGWEVLGIEDGFQGVYEKRAHRLEPKSVREILTRGGTILGSSNRANPFAYPLKKPGGGEEVRDVSEECLANLREMGVDALVAVGGDGTMTMAQGLFERGLKVVGVPKTIDNDLAATDYTFGFNTAVEVATEAIDRLHTTAESHDRIILCEVMGRYAGWIALTAGIAGGADVILIPEIPYQLDRIVEQVKRRTASGITYSIFVVAEGARPDGGDLAVVKKSDATQQERLGGAADRLAHALSERIEYDMRVTVLGHIQRGGTPSAFDRVLGTRYGVKAVDLIAEGGFGRVVNLRGNEIGSAPIIDACKKIKLVDPDGDLVAAARAVGVEMGA